ncbi:MAG: diphosphomevalonate decarboxylase [Aerococcus sp.]|nr:diphosphomevalonate decarboxylase [Aerococcus sp.]
MQQNSTWRAHNNIALIKYWGKRDEALILPMNSNLSLTLDEFYTDTTITFSRSLAEDSLILNDKPVSTAKMTPFLDLFRTVAKTNLKAQVISVNHVPTGAGLASSASAFAAAAAAASDALHLNFSLPLLSRYARRGSGSACRSVYGGFVEWQKGTDDETSYAVPFDDANWDIAMVTVMINTQPKKISSRAGMRHTVETSAYYAQWVDSAEDDLTLIKPAIKAHDFDTVGKIAERNAFRMHATTLASDPPFWYLEPETLHAIQVIHALRDEGFSVYITMDAGPNVKVLCRKSESHQIKERLQQQLNNTEILIATPGPGVQRVMGDLND